MKKLVVIIAVVILLSLLLLPFAAGMLVQSDLEQRVASMNENGLFSAELTSYERGWRSTTARLELGLSQGYIDLLAGNAGAALQGAAMLSERLVVLIDVAHGPVVIKDGVHVGIANVLARSDPDAPYMAALTAAGMPYLFEFRGRSGFGTFEFDADVPPADFANAMGEIAFSGITVDGSASGDVLTVRGLMPEIAIDSPFLAMSIADISIDTETHFVADRPYQLGTAEIRAGRVIATNPMAGADAALTLEGLRVATDTRLSTTGDAITAMVDYGLDSVSAGSEFAMTDALVRLTLDNVDAAAFEAYANLIKSAMEQQPADPTTLLAELAPLAGQFLRAGPVLTIEPIQFSMQQGSFNGRVSVAIDAGALPGTGPINYQDPALMMSAVSADADARISKALVRYIAEQIASEQIAANAAASGEPLTEAEVESMVSTQVGMMLLTATGMGIVTDDGNDYSTNVSIANGQLLVNGSPLPVGLPFP